MVSWAGHPAGPGHRTVVLPPPSLTVDDIDLACEARTPLELFFSGAPSNGAREGR